MEENKPTTLTLQHYNTVSWTGPWDADLDTLMEGFVGCLIGCGFGPEWVIRHMKEWCEEHLPEDKETEERNCDMIWEKW